MDRRQFVGLSAGVAGLGAMALSGCSGNAVSDSGSTTSTSKKISEMTSDELQEAWEKEPMYGKTLTANNTGNLCLSCFALADLLGYYEDEGLDVEFVQSQDTPDLLGTGKAQFGGTHIAHAMVPAANGLAMKMVAPIQTGCQSLYVLGSSDFKTTADLKGQTIAVPMGIGTPDQNIVFRFMIRDGHDAQNDFKYKQVDTSAVVQALQNGEIQASLLPDMFAAQFVADGTLRYIRSITYDSDFEYEPCCTICINTDFLEENPITAYKAIKCAHDAAVWMGENPEEGAQYAIDNNWATGGVDNAVKYINEWHWDLSQDDMKETLKSVIEDYKSLKLFDNSDQSVDEILDRVWYDILDA